MKDTSSTRSDASRLRYRFADLVLDLGRRQVSRDGEAVPLSKLSFEFLRVLVEAAPNLVGHDELARQAWGPARIVTPENLAKRVLLLRQALGDHADEPRYVEGLRGQGYRLLPPVERLAPAEPPALIGGAEREQSGGPGAGAMRPAVWPVAAVVMLGAIAGGAYMVTQREIAAPPRPTVRFEVVPAPGEPFLPASYVRDLAVSPDGSAIAYKSNENSLIVRPLDRIEPRRLAGLGTDIRSPTFSPDGEYVAFLDGAVLKRVPTSGRGISETMAWVGQFTDGDVHWAADGAIYIANSQGLQRLAETGETLELLATPERDAGELAFGAPFPLPGGRSILFSVAPTRAEHGTRIAVFDTATGRYDYLLENATQPAYIDTGHLIFASNGELRAIAFDPRTFAASPEQVVLADDLLVNKNGSAQVSLAADGTLVYAVGDAPVPSHLVWVGRDGSEEVLPVPAMSYTYPRLSPDGSRIALDVRWPDSDIWVWSMQRSLLTRLTNDPAENVLPTWHPSGRQLFFGDARSGVANVYAQDADGAGPVEHLIDNPRRQLPFGITPDGQTLIFGSADPGGDWHMYLYDLDTGGTRPLLNRAGYSFWNTDLSPDGRWIAYQSDESGRLEVYVAPFPDSGSRRWKISTNGGTKPMWGKDGREVFYVSPDLALMVVDITFDPGLVPSTARVELDMSRYSRRPYESGARPYDLSADGERFLILRAGLPGTPADAGQRRPRIVVSVDWTHELAERLRLPGSR